MRLFCGLHPDSLCFPGSVLEQSLVFVSSWRWHHQVRNQCVVTNGSLHPNCHLPQFHCLQWMVPGLEVVSQLFSKLYLCRGHHQTNEWSHYPPSFPRRWEWRSQRSRFTIWSNSEGSCRIPWARVRFCARGCWRLTLLVSSLSVDVFSVVHCFAKAQTWLWQFTAKFLSILWQVFEPVRLETRITLTLWRGHLSHRLKDWLIAFDSLMLDVFTSGLRETHHMVNMSVASNKLLPWNTW